MPKLRNPGAASCVIFGLACALVAFLHYMKAPESGKLAAELVALAIAAFGARSALESKATRSSGIRPRMNTWPEVKPPPVVNTEIIDESPRTPRSGGFALQELVVTVAAFGLMIMALARVTMACRPGQALSPDPARETARAAVLTTAEAIRLSDLECAKIVRATSDRSLGERCDRVYVAARAALVGAAAGVDVWDKVESRESVTCAVVDASRELASLAQELRAKGGGVLASVEDALAFVRALGVCKRGGDA